MRLMGMIMGMHTRTSHSHEHYYTRHVALVVDFLLPPMQKQRLTFQTLSLSLCIRHHHIDRFPPPWERKRLAVCSARGSAQGASERPAPYSKAIRMHSLPPKLYANAHGLVSTAAVATTRREISSGSPCKISTQLLMCVGICNVGM